MDSHNTEPDMDPYKLLQNGEIYRKAVEVCAGICAITIAYMLSKQDQ